MNVKCWLERMQADDASQEKAIIIFIFFFQNLKVLKILNYLLSNQLYWIKFKRFENNLQAEGTLKKQQQGHGVSLATSNPT